MEILKAYFNFCIAILQENIDIFGYSISLANIFFYGFIASLLLTLLYKIFS